MSLRTYGRRPGVSPKQDDTDRPVTSIYERTRSVTESTVKSQGPRTVRDRVCHRLSDGAFHSAYELDREIPLVSRGEWYAAVAQLMEAGFSFARRGNSLRMGRLRTHEKPQDVAELLAGIDATVDDRLPSQRATSSKPMVIGGDIPDVPGWDDEPGEAYDTEEPFSEFSGSAVEDVASDNTLVLSEDSTCVLPARGYVTSTKAVLAKKRVGKTYLSMVVAEEFLARRLPFVVLDPTGVWWGINATRKGGPSDCPVLLIGGPHGVFNLRSDNGSKMADVVVKIWPTPIVFDLVDLSPDEQRQFVADFGDRLYKENKKAVHVFIDEGDEFAPQSLDKSDKVSARCLRVIDRIVRRGGVKGIGSTIITQRPAVLNKNVLSQVDGTYYLQIVAPQDRAAVEDWMKNVVSPSDLSSCISNISRLGRGEAYYMQSGGQPPLVKFRVREKRTFDSSKTPTIDDPEPYVPSLGVVSRDILEEVAALLGEEVESFDGSEG